MTFDLGGAKIPHTRATDIARARSTASHPPEQLDMMPCTRTHVRDTTLNGPAVAGHELNTAHHYNICCLFVCAQ
jgi:hypothetical protein